MNRLDELEDEILQRTRRAYSPSASSQARLQVATLTAISAGVVVQTASSHAPWRDTALENVRDIAERVQSSWSLRGALALGFALGGAGVGGYALGLREGQSRLPVSPPPAQGPVEPAPPANVVAPPSEPQTPEQPPPVLAPERARQPSRDYEPPSASSASPTEVELGLLRRVERVLRMGDPRFALVLLGELDQQVPRGKFMEERLAARTTANCQIDRSSATVKAAASFEHRYPNSVYGARVREACVASEPGAGEKNEEASKDNTQAAEQNRLPPEIHSGKGVTKP